MIEKEILAYCGKAKTYLAQSLAYNCCKLLANVVFSAVLANFLNFFLKGEWLLSFPLSGFLLILSLILRQVSLRNAWKANQELVKELKLELRQSLYRKVLELGTLYRETMTSQEVLQNGVEGIENLESYFGLYLGQLYYCICSTLILFLIILPIQAKVALILLLLSPLIPLFLAFILRMVKNVQRKYWSKYADVGNLFLDSLEGMTTLKVFQADQARAKEMDLMAEGFRKETMKLLAMQLNSLVLIDWLAYGGAIAGTLVSLKQYQAGDLNLYALLFILLLIMEFFVPMRTLSSYFHIAMTGIASAEKILDLMKRKPDFSYGEANYKKESDLTVRHLSYSYSDGFEALKDLTMQFPYQQMTAIVGPSGSGKSTLAALLAGQYQAQEGQVYCGNVPFQELKKGEIAKNVIRISHDGHLFQDTLKNNLRLAKEEATEEEMIRVLEKVGLWGFFKAREGLETMILSQGKNLSGGQAQRVCLARALLFDAQVYIFDEASSNVDSTSEKIILEQIHRLSKEKTVVYISHRLDTVKEASNIYVLNHGHLIEHGQHDQLMKEKGLYKKLYQEQTAIDRFLTDDLTEEEVFNLVDVASEEEVFDLVDLASKNKLDDLEDGFRKKKLDDLGAPVTRERKALETRARKNLRGEKDE